jgi:hypothetical protein
LVDLAIGPITSLVSVNAPIGNFFVGNIGYASIGISSAVFMFDTINSLIYNTHSHPKAGPVIGKFLSA